MKKAIILFFLLSSVAVSAQLQSTSYADAAKNQTGELIFVYNEVFGFTEKKGDEVQGLLVDLMIEFEKYVLEKEGIRLTHKFVYLENNFSAFLDQVRNGNSGVFGLGNVSITEERKKQFSFSPAYLDNVSLLVTSTGVDNLKTMDQISTQFKGMKGYSIRSTTTDVRMKRMKEEFLPSLEIEYLNSGNEIISRVSTDSQSFAILDLNFYLEALSRRSPIRRHAVFDEKDEPFGIIMPKNSDWSPLLKKFFESGFIQSSTYSKIISRNLGNSALGLIKSMRHQ